MRSRVGLASVEGDKLACMSQNPNFDDVPLPDGPYDGGHSMPDVASGASFGGNAYRAGNAGSGASGELDRQMPQNVSAEQGVLGGMLMNNNAIADAIAVLTGEDFYRPQHKLIYETIVDLFGSGENADIITVSAQLDNYNRLEYVGGATYLHTLVSKTPTSANLTYYAGLVREKSLLRQLVQAGTRIVQYGYAGLEGDEVSSVIDRAQQEVFGITNTTLTTDYSRVGDLVEEVAQEIDDLTNGEGEAGIKTGFYDLDDLTNGLAGGQMVIIAARPGVGKSTLALDFMRSCSMKQNLPSVLFSLEMSKSEVMMRVFSAEASVPLSKMRGGKMEGSDWQQLNAALPTIQDAPLYIDDSPNLTMMEIRSKARRLKQEVGLRMVVVDYLQLMSSGKRVESRQQEVSEFSRQLKLLAKEIDVPVIAISQLNRGVENRGEDALPKVSDLRESGSLEQDADMVMLINRPDSQNKDHPRAGEADIILAKHRGGPIGTVEVAAELQFSRFADLASKDYGPMA